MPESVANHQGVITATIAAGASIIAAFIAGAFTYLAARSKLVQQAEERADDALRELHFQSKSLGFDEFEAGLEWSDTEAVQDLMRRKLLSGEFDAFRVWEGRF